MYIREMYETDVRAIVSCTVHLVKVIQLRISHTFDGITLARNVIKFFGLHG